MVVLQVVAAILADKLVTWLVTARTPIPNQVHVVEVLLVVDMVVASGEEWSATTGLRHAISAVDQTTTHVTARRKR
jgi:hypothetical protein